MRAGIVVALILFCGFVQADQTPKKTVAAKKKKNYSKKF